MTKARDLASGSGIEAGEVVPHIIPGVLYPAVAGKDLSGTALGGSYTYGTAHTDGRSYYYTDIKGSKPIKDPRIGAHFGSHRHTFRSRQLLEQETSTHGTNVYTLDGREWCRMVGKNWTEQNGNDGIRFYNSTVGDFVEITGYFSGANFLTMSSTTNDIALAIDGTTDTATYTAATSAVDSPNQDRFVNVSVCINLAFSSTPTLGIHTLKIFVVSGDYIRIEGIELIAQDIGSTARRSQINIPAQNVVSYGKKFSIGSATLTNAVHKHYNPFAFKTDGTTAWASGADNGTSWPVGTGSSHNIDTATSLGLEKWKHGDNYYKPYNGGRVVRWIANDGTIKTSVTVMPPNARSSGNSASLTNGTAKANASIANNTFYPTFEAGTIDYSLSEVAKKYLWQEFGNGSANGHSHYADANYLTSGTADDIAYVMDDGLTGLSGSLTFDYTVPEDLFPSATDKTLYLTFIGSGLTFYDEVDEVWEELALNLPYGSHMLTFKRHSSVESSPLILDGVTIKTEWMRFKEFAFHQPKMPPVPADACIIADYMLMADFVKQSATGSDIYGHISKGSRLVDSSREHYYTSSAAFYGDTTKPRFDVVGLGVKNTSADATVKLPFFGTTAAFHCSDSSQAWTSELGGSTATETKLDNTANVMGDAVTLAETVALGQTTFQTIIPTGEYMFVSSQVATPIHTSHHYQTFEGPYWYELLGGDRNMEQTNLIVTADGKSWDEVTRDTSYMGLPVHNPNTDTGSTNVLTYQVFDEFRGLHNNDQKQNKNFTSDRDGRQICLVEGLYRIEGLTHRNTATNHSVRIYHNDNQVALGHHGNTEHDNVFMYVILNLKRSDTIRIRGYWMASNVMSKFSITRVG